MGGWGIEGWDKKGEGIDGKGVLWMVYSGRFWKWKR